MAVRSHRGLPRLVGSWPEQLRMDRRGISYGHRFATPAPSALPPRVWDLAVLRSLDARVGYSTGLSAAGGWIHVPRSAVLWSDDILPLRIQSQRKGAP